jgi:class 3 adenylate cyclase/hemoglobin-like flavoprotein
MTITFLEGGDREVTVESSPGTSILDTALRNSLPHVHDCGGNARCSTCRVRVVNGLEHLSPRTTEEREIAQTYGWTDDIRLACQTRTRGNISVERLVHHDERRPQQEEDALPVRSQELHLAVLFCDINAFTDFAAGCMPYDVVHVINRLFLRMGEAVLSNSGYIDKYLGDGLLALWGVYGGTNQENCLAAVRAGLLMQRWIRELGPRLTPHFGRELSIRAGIHFGPAIVGRIGHPARQQLTAIGDTVNIASRVEAANKDLRTQFLVTEECYAQISEEVIVGDDFKTVLRGQSRPQRLFEIVGLKAPDAAFIVQSQLARVSLNGEALVQSFYRHLFAVPEIQQLFASTDLPQQHQRFLEQFTALVGQCRTPGRVAEQLTALALRHRRYGVKAEHLRHAKEAMLAALGETLQDEFDAQSRAAWTQVIEWIGTVMQRVLMTSGGAQWGQSSGQSLKVDCAEKPSVLD